MVYIQAKFWAVKLQPSLQIFVWTFVNSADISSIFFSIIKILILLIYPIIVFFFLEIKTWEIGEPWEILLDMYTSAMLCFFILMIILYLYKFLEIYYTMLVSTCYLKKLCIRQAWFTLLKVPDISKKRNNTTFLKFQIA